MNLPNVPSGFGLAGLIIGVLGILLPYLVNLRKGKVDESAVLLGEWRQMVDQHARDITELRDELRKERQENSALRKSLNDAHDKIAGLQDQINVIKQRHVSEIAAKDNEIEGLRRQIIQNSKSSAQLLGDPASLAITRASRKKRGDE